MFKNLAVWLLRRIVGMTSEQLERHRQNGFTLKFIGTAREHREATCNHRRGGYIHTFRSGRVVWPSVGNDENYAVIKHQFANGDLWVRCLRCGRTWKPPIKTGFWFFKSREYKRALKEYREVIAYPTRNTGSSSVQMKFRDNGQTYRNALAQS